MQCGGWDASQGSEDSRGTFEKGLTFFRVQSISLQAFMRSHWRNGPAHAHGALGSESNPCAMSEEFLHSQGSVALPKGSDVLPGAWQAPPPS